MNTTCLHCGASDVHEKIVSVGGTWHRCAKCNYAWRGLGQNVASMFRRPRRDALTQAGPCPATSLAPATEGAAPATEAPAARPHASADPRSPDQERRGDGHWLADVEARFDGGREVTVDASVANSSPASAPDSQTGAKRQPVRGLKAEPGDGEQPDDSVAPAVDHWLADVEATYERETSVDPTADNWLAGVEPADVQGDVRATKRPARPSVRRQARLVSSSTTGSMTWRRSSRCNVPPPTCVVMLSDGSKTRKPDNPVSAIRMCPSAPHAMTPYRRRPCRWPTLCLASVTWTPTSCELGTHLPRAMRRSRVS